MKYMKTHTTKNYIRKRILPPEQFAKGSFRLKPLTEGRKLVIACPIGKWNKKSKRCLVGTVAQALLIPRAKKKK